MANIENFIEGNTQIKAYWINTAPSKSITAVSNNPSFKSEIKDEYIKAKNSNGIVRKTYDSLKNSTGIGSGSKILAQQLEKYEKGEISEEEIRKDLSKYKISQENSIQAIADLGTAATTIGTYYLANNGLKKLRNYIKLNAVPEMLVDLYKNVIKEAFGNLLKNGKYEKLEKNVKEILMSNKKSNLILLPILAIIGGLTKLYIIKSERALGSKEYKADKKLDKTARKEQKKLLKKERKKANLKAFGTGAVNGLLSPITALGGGLIGAPAYALALTGMNYFTNKNNNNTKNLNDFIQKYKDNGIINTTTLLLLALPALKHSQFSKVLRKNLDTVYKNLKGVKLEYPKLKMKNAYQELEEKMFESENIRSILHNYNIKDEEKIINLTKENIFAVKFIQIGRTNSLSTALRENCPPSRTIQEAQNTINRLLGNTDFEVSKLLGVGTIAETYLAKDKNGKEVCIKILKDGITLDKIEKDKAKFIELITKGRKLEDLTLDEKYLIKNIEDLAKGISSEVDFVNEMNAAKELAQYTKKAHVVKPICAKDGIYIMEKAPGISIKTFSEYIECKEKLKITTKLKKRLEQEQQSEYVIRKIKDTDDEIQNLKKELEEIKSKSPDFADFDVEHKHIVKLCNEYVKVLTEQFNKLNRNGKVLHADIHPGNIFVNLEALKSGRGKLFTLIDTGNTIRLSKEQSIATLQLTKFIKNGNYKDLAKIIIDEGILPKGMTREKALVEIEKELKNLFLDNKTKINQMTIEEFNNLSQALLRKHDIVPSNTQLNLLKARKSAMNSLEELMKSFMESIIGQSKLIEKEERDKLTKFGKFKETLKLIWHSCKTMKLGLNFTYRPLAQESLNLLKLSPSELYKFLRNPNMQKTNSVEYLTYKTKQNIPVNRWQ